MVFCDWKKNIVFQLNNRVGCNSSRRGNHPQPFQFPVDLSRHPITLPTVTKLTKLKAGFTLGLPNFPSWLILKSLPLTPANCLLKFLIRRLFNLLTKRKFLFRKNLVDKHLAKYWQSSKTKEWINMDGNNFFCNDREWYKVDHWHFFSFFSIGDIKCYHSLENISLSGFIMLEERVETFFFS